MHQVSLVALVVCSRIKPESCDAMKYRAVPAGAGTLLSRGEGVVTNLKNGDSTRSEATPRRELREKLDAVADACTSCGACQSECAFLTKYGVPKVIAGRYNPLRKEDQGLSFECSLCGLCTAVCPEGIDPSELFLEMRRETAKRDGGDFAEHRPQIAYERRGTSRTYSWYGLPAGCDTVFFPGCALSGTRSDKVITTYLRLKERFPALGIVLDCCTKSSHDLGRVEHFTAMFGEMREYLVAHGIRHVLVACPNCYKVFARYGAGLSVRTIYEIMARKPCPEDTAPPANEFTIHDSCAVRQEESIHEAVRMLIRQQGHATQEMPHSGPLTFCCGEGGAVGSLAPAFPRQWGRLRKKEAAGRKVVTYCAGCASMLGRYVPVVHILDLLFCPSTDEAKITRPPFTYWKRLRLKRWFKKHVPAVVTRERVLSGPDKRKGGVVKFLIFLLFLATVIATAKTSGLSKYFEQQTLRAWIADYSSLAPLVYMLVYAIAPALFLPGLPITIVGGILFGPFWGVYTVIGATAGACVAFLVSRYLAREWVAARLKSPRWRRLDESVENHGWKVVAFTRLVPLFPFNLLNYAFGLTKIGFRQYTLTTSLCMLPACIAFIVFSSSLLDLIKGHISLNFIIGLVLIILVSLFPLFYRRHKKRQGEEDPV
jgi:uncharacterized membrane protein YdjX (TVP38/TMEM64 family)/Fe-S oxidoreductase